MKRGSELALLLGLVVSTATCHSVPPSLPDARDRVRTWVESGAYARRLDAVVAPAQRRLDRRADAVERPALVLDIDETSLSSWSYQSDHAFCYTPESFDAWVAASTPPAIAATLELTVRRSAATWPSSS
ncbi:MAG: HAD family acid phosphatase [Thermoanaerobaculia bacterium]